MPRCFRASPAWPTVAGRRSPQAHAVRVVTSLDEGEYLDQRTLSLSMELVAINTATLLLYYTRCDLVFGQPVSLTTFGATDAIALAASVTSATAAPEALIALAAVAQASPTRHPCRVLLASRPSPTHHLCRVLFATVCRAFLGSEAGVFPATRS